MKRLLGAIVFGAWTLASAGELENADKFLVAKAYDKAFPIYARLAEAGNVEAQFRLGEMYWYGDGTGVDVKTATNWMQKAAARGHGGAVESLAILKQREAKAAEIAYWAGTDRDEALVSGRYDCQTPVIPESSRTAEEIKATAGAYAKWQACYNGFVADVNRVTAPAGRIPVDILKLMTPGEAEKAAKRVDAAYQQAIERSQQDATRVVASYAMWESATERQVRAENMARKNDLELTMRRIDERELNAAVRYRTMIPAVTPTQVPVKVTPSQEPVK